MIVYGEMIDGVQKQFSKAARTREDCSGGAGRLDGEGTDFGGDGALELKLYFLRCSFSLFLALE